jgi:hypothetical protein
MYKDLFYLRIHNIGNVLLVSVCLLLLPIQKKFHFNSQLATSQILNLLRIELRTNVWGGKVAYTMTMTLFGRFDHVYIYYMLLTYVLVFGHYSTL